MSAPNIINQSTSMPTGRVAIWWFLASEIAIFGGLVMCYILFRLARPEWALESAKAVQAAGALNTVVLLSSSLTAVLAHDAMHRGKEKIASNYLFVTLAFGGVFMCVKAYEYSQKIHHGLTPSTHLFWAFYFFMTGLHAFHVFLGMIAMAIIAVKIRSGKCQAGVEYVGIYWHFVDLVWIFLFPLLYIAG
ncbi:MAG: cytochrome c oxidase subunit 3 [Planctomycetes bacterium]|nr:cytochrome c oxidase subunit 3 [Planctomycetota bacterium]